MGYGSGIGLLVVGLIFALAIRANAPGIDLTMLGWILALAGVAVIVFTAVQTNMRRRTTTVQRTRNADGTESVSERNIESDPPPPPAY